MITFPDHIQDAFDELRSKGFAVVVFTPGELQGVNPKDIEEAMIITGWEAIARDKDPAIPDYNWEDDIEIYPTGE